MRRNKVSLNAFQLLLLTVILFSLGCKGSTDSDYFPYAMKGLNVLVYNNKTDKEYSGGYVEANYLSRSEGLTKCQNAAYSTAKANYLEDWSYVCCTVTSSSGCVTKVK